MRGILFSYEMIGLAVGREELGRLAWSEPARRAASGPKALGPDPEI